MFKPKLKHVVLLVCVAVVALGAVALASADIRPANPTMDYVPQNVGIYDTYYCNFKEPDCRVCHGTSTAERHHATEYALTGNCLYCHSVIPGVVPPERDCKVCHVDGGPIVDLGMPHHRSDLADSDQCTQCHSPNLLVETNTVEPPNYEPSSITPTPYSCENCHWPSGKFPYQAATYDGSTAKFLNDWLKWRDPLDGSPYSPPIPTTWPDGLDHPQSIEANGPVFSGVLHASKPYRPQEGTHHFSDGWTKVYPKCYNCHGTNPDTDPSWDPENPYLIRMCENCHDVGTLHGIAEHVTYGIGGLNQGGYTVNSVLNNVVTANEKCVACHGDVLPLLPPSVPVVPSITTLEPDFGSPGIVTTIYGSNFGQKLNNDRVLQGQKDMLTGNWVYTEVPIYSWSETQIQFKVPGWTFQPGDTRVKVKKITWVEDNPAPGGNNDGLCDPGETCKEATRYSAVTDFNVRKHPEINSLTPPSGTWGMDVVINGEGFGVLKEKVYTTGYGYSTYVELHASNDEYRATVYPGAWLGPNQIKIRLKKILDTDTGVEITDIAQLFQGCWNTKVITDYFKDDGDGKYNYGLSGLDIDRTAIENELYLKNSDEPNDNGTCPACTGDIVLYREISDPTCFTVTNDPVIKCVRPLKPLHGDTATIYGANFSPTQREKIGDGKGDDDGLCETGEVCENYVRVGNSSMSSYKVAKIVYWSNTAIKFIVPTFANLPKYKYVQVVVPDDVVGDNDESNKYKIRIR